MADPTKSVQAPHSLSERVAKEAHRLKPAYKAYKGVADPLKNFNYARDQFVDKGLIPGDDRFDLFYAKFKKVDKWVKTAERVRKLLVPEERYGLILKDAVEEALKLIAKVLNVSERAFLSHPYYVFHAAHMDILLACLGAVTKVDKAEESLKQASKLAAEIQEQANRVESAFDPTKDADIRQLDSYYAWWDVYKRSLRDATLTRAVNVTESELRDVDYALGQAVGLNAKVQQSAESVLEYWVMMQVDVSNVGAAIVRYEKSIEELKKGNIFDRVFGQMSDKHKEERIVFDEIDNTGDPNADPEKATHRAVRKVEVLMQKWMNIADRANEGRRLLQ